MNVYANNRNYSSINVMMLGSKGLLPPLIPDCSAASLFSISHLLFPIRPECGLYPGMALQTSAAGIQSTLCSFWGFCSPFQNVINRCFCIILSTAINTTGGFFHFSFAASPCISASSCPLQQNSAGSGKGCSVLLCTAIICPEVSSFFRLRTE